MSHRIVSLGVPVLLAVGMAACGSDGRSGDAERFCGEIEANKAALTDPRIEFADDIEPFVELYRSIGELAPLSIEAEWDQLTLNYETASTVVPGDADSEQLAVVTALQSEKSAAKVSEWLRRTCAVELGPLSTIVDHSG